MLLKGVRGFLRWSYDTAATLQGWSVSKHKDGTFRLSAAVVDANPFMVKQRPLTFVAPIQATELKWAITTLEIANGRITATLGAREKT